MVVVVVGRFNANGTIKQMVASNNATFPYAFLVIMNNKDTLNNKHWIVRTR